MAQLNSLGLAVISGVSAALTLIQQFLANPTIAGIPISCTDYKELLTAEVSQQLIVNLNQGKNFISDNIAPHPRVWEISGFLDPAFFEITALASVLQPILQLKVQSLRNAFNSRQSVLFKTKDFGEIIQVGIRELTFTSDPAIINKVPIQVTVQEIPILNQQFSAVSNVATNPLSQSITNAASAPVNIGNVLGNAALNLVIP